jgi:hypothetical protein
MTSLPQLEEKIYSLMPELKREWYETKVFGISKIRLQKTSLRTERRVPQLVTYTTYLTFITMLKIQITQEFYNGQQVQDALEIIAVQIKH